MPKFYKDDLDPASALFDALIWALDKDPSPCRCICDDLCRAHQALARAKSAGVTSPYGRKA